MTHVRRVPWVRVCVVAWVVGFGVLVAAEPAIRLPVQEQPIPLPVPASDATKLPAGSLYIVDSDTPIIVMASPGNLVTITAEEGPMKIRAVFAGNTNVSTRTFKGKYLSLVEAVPDKSGRVELFVVPVGLKAEAEVIRRVLDVGSGVGPQPPPPKPEPEDIAPIKVDGFRILMVYDSRNSHLMPASQLAILTAGEIRQYVIDKCAVGPDGRTKEFRVLSPTQDISGESKLWKDAMALPRKALPWLVVSNGKTGYSGPLPATVADTMVILKKYGGQ